MLCCIVARAAEGAAFFFGEVWGLLFLRFRGMFSF
jgi:hypothetical protein